ncbi:putative polysaccharide biosynthesis protein [Lacticaseibacillus parakribbianus]|uniref:putative polysaccharide biosynthesis protein n=1 Tax=Lacticaseibacillus parakribbianus TaxID=2970927 RepID=UPI0021CAFDE2|nr:polysaccharide biosynthesis protein [Lacticaseibacillus parakribbianus]
MDKQKVAARPQRSAKELMLRGSAWMTAGSILSRVLGAIYIIPWRIWLGAAYLTANSLFTKGYQIYNIFLIVSTAGVPGAISKQIARYNAMNEYKTGMRLFYHGAVAMSIMGVVACGLLWVLAPVLALRDAALTQVFRTLAWPLLLIPLLSVMRGFFQGYNEMAPSALSQFIEQVARVIYMLLMTYTIMVIGNHNYVDAVAQSTFAAFVGAVFGLLLLIGYFFHQRGRFAELAASSSGNVHISTKRILLEIAQQAFPFIVMGAATNLYYIIDQYTFDPMMLTHYIVSKHALGELYALFAGNANKLIMIVVSLAVAMASTALPLLAAAKTRGVGREIADNITNILQLFFIVMIPSALGMAAVSQPLYVVFFGYDKLGISVMELSSFLAVFFGLFTVLASVLQGLFHNRLAMKIMVVGVAVKFIFQWPLIVLFNVYGPTLATMLGMAASIALMLWQLRDLYHFKARQTLRRLVGITAFAVVMAVVVRVLVWLMSQVLNPASGMQSMLMLVVALPIGVAIYAYAVLKTRLADLIIGRRIGSIRQKLHIG